MFSFVSLVTFVVYQHRMRKCSTRFEGSPASEGGTMSRARRIRLSLAAIVAAQFVLIPASAQSPRPMGIVDLLSVPRLTDPRLSPDGRDVVFVRSDADWKSGKRITHLSRAGVDRGAPVQLTN